MIGEIKKTLVIELNVEEVMLLRDILKHEAFKEFIIVNYDGPWVRIIDELRNMLINA